MYSAPRVSPATVAPGPKTAHSAMMSLSAHPAPQCDTPVAVTAQPGSYAPRHDCRCDREDRRADAPAVVAATTTWAEFPTMWGPMLDEVWSFLRGIAAEGLYKQGHNIMLYKDDIPNVEVGVQVSGVFDPV